MPYKYFGALAVTILVAGLLFVVCKWPSSRHKTFSQHVALKRTSIIYYFMIFSVVLPLLVSFFVGWFTSNFHFTFWFNVLVVLSALSQLACTLAPEVGGRMTTWHKGLAGVSALLLMPAMALIVFSGSVSLLHRLVSLLSFIIMGYCVYLACKSKGNSRNSLLIQSVYFAAFFVPIMAISYL